MRVLLLALALMGCTIERIVPPVPVDPVIPSPVNPVVAPNLRVLIIEETAERHKVPSKQLVILTAKAIRDYAKEKCAKGPGGHPDFRVWDKDVDASKDGSPALRTMLAKPRQSLPWIVITNDKTEFSGPLPASVDETLALLKKYGG